MTHCMIPQSLAHIQIRLREATRDIQDHTADEWTSSDMNRSPLILNTIYSQAGPIALWEIKKPTNREVLYKLSDDIHCLDKVQLLIIHHLSVLPKSAYQEESIIEAARRRLRSHSGCDQEGRNSAHTSAKKNPFNKVKPWNRLIDTVSDAEKGKEKRRTSIFPGETHNTSIHGMKWNVASGERRRRKHGICPKERWTHAKDNNCFSRWKKCHLTSANYLPGWAESCHSEDREESWLVVIAFFNPNKHSVALHFSPVLLRNNWHNITGKVPDAQHNGLIHIDCKMITEISLVNIHHLIEIQWKKKK